MHRAVRLCCSLFLCAFSTVLFAQAAQSAKAGTRRKELYGGYSFFSNSFNGHTTATSHTPLNGWDAGFSAPVWHQSSVRIDVSGYYGTSLGSPQRPMLYMGGVQYNKRLGKFTGFVDGLAGLGHLNSDWWGGEYKGKTFSFAGQGGGGLDIPISPRLAFRVEGDLVYADFTIPDDQIHGLPNYFARITTGLVWNY